MKSSRLLYVLVVVATLVLSACAPAPSGSAAIAQPTEAMMAQPTQEAMMQATSTPEAMMAEPTQAAMMDQTTTPGAMMEDTATPEAMMAKPTESAMMEPTTTPEAMMAQPTQDAMMQATASSEAMMQETATPEAMMAKPTEGAMMGTPAWFGTMLTNVSTGKSFSIDSFKGKVVLVETMAQSCPTCKQGELNIKAAEEKLGMPADLVTISLDVSATDATDALRSYAANNGFAWAFAVAPAAVSSEIGQLYGDQFLKLSSPGLLVIDRQGTAHPLPAGLSTTDDLLMALDPYLKGM